MSLAFPQSPALVLEQAIKKFEEDAIDLDTFLGTLEQQHARVDLWIEEIERLDPGASQRVSLVKEMGLNGTTKMIEALEAIHEAALEDEFDKVEEEILNLVEGHKLILESFEMCDQAEEEHVQSIVEAVGGYMT